MNTTSSCLRAGFSSPHKSILMDYTNLKHPEERLGWCAGRLSGLIGTTRYQLEDELIEELKEILYVLENQ